MIGDYMKERIYIFYDKIGLHAWTDSKRLYKIYYEHNPSLRVVKKKIDDVTLDLLGTRKSEYKLSEMSYDYVEQEPLISSNSLINNAYSTIIGDFVDSLEIGYFPREEDDDDYVPEMNIREFFYIRYKNYNKTLKLLTDKLLKRDCDIIYGFDSHLDIEELCKSLYEI